MSLPKREQAEPGTTTNPYDPVPKIGESSDLISRHNDPGLTAPAAGSGSLTILQLVLSLVAMLSLWGFALLLLILGLMSLPAIQGTGVSNNLGFVLQSAGLAVCGVLLMPSVITSILRLRRTPLAENYQPLLNLSPLVPLLLLLPVLGIGYWATTTNFAAVVLPFLHALAVILPVLFLVILSVRRLETGSPQRRSGVFAAGLALGPFVILILEALAFVGMIVVVGLFIANQPELVERLYSLAEQLTVYQGSPEELLRLITPFLTSPVVILAAITFIAVIVPLIEELFKPIGVWFLAGRAPTPGEGFAAGALSGAGFAIFESIMLNTGSDDWLAGSVLRIGTAVIHILNTALSGWALACAWREGRYLRLALIYLGVVSLHGLWNGVTILSVFYELGGSEGIVIDIPYLETIATLAPYILAFLTLGGFLLLLFMNRKLRHQSVPEAFHNQPS